MSEGENRSESLALLIEEQQDQIAVEIVDAFLKSYPNSNSAKLNREELLSWTKEELCEALSVLRGSETVPNIDLFYFGDAITQGSEVFLPLANYIEGKLFVGKQLAEYFWKLHVGNPRQAQREVLLIEEMTLRLVKAATHHYIDHSLRPGVLVDSWKSGLVGESVESKSQDTALQFSRREYEVLHLVSFGKSNNEIAAELHIQPNTVKNHLARMYDKANVNNRTELVRWAINHGLG